jgi:hypothetical protein
MQEKLRGLINKYRMLRAERDSGRLSDEEYKRQLEGSAVADPSNEGCWWNISPESGLWIYFDGREWTQRAPEGYDPMVSTGAPVTAARPAARGGAAWVWIVVAAVAVVLLIAGGITIALLLSQGGGPGGGGGGEAADKVEEALDDFYKAVEKGEYRDVEDLVTGRLAKDLKGREDANTLEDYFDPYKGVRAKFDDVEIDGKEATAKIELRKDTERFEQDAELELVGNKWLVSRLSEPKRLTAKEQGQEREPIERVEQGGANESQIRAFLNEFLSAFRNFDLDRMRTMMAGEALTELDDMEAIRQDPDQLEAYKEQMQELTWEIRDLKIEGGGNRATAVIYLNLVEAPQTVTLERSGGRWTIIKVEGGESDTKN